MKEIKWKHNGNRSVSTANVGGIFLRCCCIRHNWYSDTSIRHIAHTIRQGPRRTLLKDAQNDAISLAQELLIDHYTSVVELMPHFGVVQPGKEE